MINCVILDDEPFAHQVLGHYILETPGLVLAAGYRNAAEAYEYLGKNKADLLFLDIEMPLVNGISFLKALPDPPKTIFTTAYKQYAFEGFELDAVDYLLKPFSYERFMKAVGKTGLLEPREEKSTGFLMIRDNHGLLNLKQEEVILVEGCGDYVRIRTAGKTYVIYHTLKNMLLKLDPVYFTQVHRSYIVNRIFITRIFQDNLILHDQSFVPVGKTYKKKLMEVLNR